MMQVGMRVACKREWTGIQIKGVDVRGRSQERGGAEIRGGLFGKSARSDAEAK